MILPFIKRRWWLIQKRLFSTIGFALLLPVLLHISINLSMKFIVVRSFWNIPYEEWVFPGLLMLVAALTLFPLLFRDFFEFRMHHNILIPVSITPISKYGILLGNLTTAVLESLTIVAVSMIVLSFLMSISFSLIDYFLIVVYIILFDVVIGNLFITLFLITRRVTTLIVPLLTIFCFLLFGSGLLVDFEFYPEIVGILFRNLPTGMIVQGLRMVLFSKSFDILAVVLPVIIIIIWFIFNSELLRRKLNQ